ncbi:MAG TPA: cyclic nucleotide-binding domain-containing protein [Gaiellaceae bacterium]|nr:cyclic nucleotide-binding domain-containing protein [Gaiellaceae bacterium]
MPGSPLGAQFIQPDEAGRRLADRPIVFLIHLMEWRLLAADHELRQIVQVARRRTFRKGEVVVHQTDPADSIHLIGKGRFAIRVMTSLGKPATVLAQEILAGMAGTSRATVNASLRDAGPRATRARSGQRPDCRSGRPRETRAIGIRAERGRINRELRRGRDIARVGQLNVGARARS